MKINIRTAFKNDLMKVPRYAHEGDAGFDLQWNGENEEELILWEGERACLPTGIFIAIPPGYELQVRSRSGMALACGVFVLNAPGTVDSTYRKEVGVILTNSDPEPYAVIAGDRIAQGVIAPVERAEFEVVDQLDETDRKGGFGSTGR